MKFSKLNLLPLLMVLLSCNSVRVTSDYDTKVEFKTYKTFAFYKKGIDKALVSDLDKKRIMRAIEKELVAKGYTKSSNPDILVSIFTKSRERIDINNNDNFGWGWGYNPWFGRNQNIRVGQYTEGTLFIDVIDKNKNELVWQGTGSGVMKIKNPERKEEKINTFVKEILSDYPPEEK